MSNSVRAINWQLEDIYPTFGDLLTNLDDWFDHKVVRDHYKGRVAGWRFHKGQLPRFAQRDRRKGTKWQAHTAKRLFAVRRAVIEMCDRLHGPDFDLWMLKNCQSVRRPAACSRPNPRQPARAIA